MQVISQIVLQRMVVDVLLRLLVQLSQLMLPVQLPLMVQFVLGIVHKTDAETKIVKILVEQLMQHVKPKELDVLLVQMENVPKFKNCEQT